LRRCLIRQACLAQGETVLLRRNSPGAGGNPALTNGQWAVVEGINVDRNVALAWPNVAGGVSRVVLSPGARSYPEADGVQGGAASTVHLAQGRTVEHAIAVLDPDQHAASYVALSRDRSSTTVVLSAEAVSNPPKTSPGCSSSPPRNARARCCSATPAACTKPGCSSSQERTYMCG